MCQLAILLLLPPTGITLKHFPLYYESMIFYYEYSFHNFENIYLNLPLRLSFYHLDSVALEYMPMPILREQQVYMQCQG